MITVVINKKQELVDSTFNLLTALNKWGYDLNSPFAVAINCTLITRNNYESTYLSEGDVIDIVFPMQGG